jgi:hypothetical protein
MIVDETSELRTGQKCIPRRSKFGLYVSSGHMSPHAISFYTNHQIKSEIRKAEPLLSL